MRIIIANQRSRRDGGAFVRRGIKTKRHLRMAWREPFVGVINNDNGINQ